MNGKLLYSLVIVPTCQIFFKGRTADDDVRPETMLLAIALQESGAQYRAQINGPARGFWQFERIGVEGVMANAKASTRLHEICVNALGIQYSPQAIHDALTLNDVLACAVARLTLAMDPRPLPPSNIADIEAAWDMYVKNWRPGKPHRERWDKNWPEAVTTVQANFYPSHTP